MERLFSLEGSWLITKNSSCRKSVEEFLLAINNYSIILNTNLQICSSTTLAAAILVIKETSLR